MTRSVCPRALVSCDCIVEPSLPQKVPSQAYASRTMHLCPASPGHHTLLSTAREMKGDTKKIDGPATYACIASSPIMSHESPRTLPSPVAIEASTVTMHEKAPQRHHIIISWNLYYTNKDEDPSPSHKTL
jgi:hypothetical protein